MGSNCTKYLDCTMLHCGEEQVVRPVTLIAEHQEMMSVKMKGDIGLQNRAE